MSNTQARKACMEFVRTINTLYSGVYLRQPTATDLKRIELLHRSVHRVPGMLGSLDCCHAQWKNCPKAWQGNFKGKEKHPSIVYEAVSDYNLWFWHVCFGHAGTMNDINILSRSPLMLQFEDGSFNCLETAAGIVPFQVGTEEFKEMFLLVDGIYPARSRFVKAVTDPVLEHERRYTAWQEAARKDIERAFGVLQMQFKWIERPIHAFNLAEISERACACMVLHNMLVSD
eukprot:Nitzschia sp. Nitz4//scaffold822_size987//126//812//NITZ4_009333-RA/size987-exonerate_protein2genome-gene-0.0-mRNA-1//1//CDS//3329558770//4022//frame0